MKRVLLILSACALLSLIASCLKDNGEGTVVLLGSESYYKPVNNVLPDTLLRFLSDKGLDLPEGSNPPDVQGEYVLYPRHLIWSNVDAIPAEDSLFFRFGGDLDTVVTPLGYYPQGQHGKVAPCDYLETYFDLNHADTVYLMGDGNGFSAYFVMTFRHINSAPGADFDLTRGFLVMGDVKEDSIRNAHVACVNVKVDVNTNNPAISGVSSELLKKMEGRIYVYGGPVVRKQWYGEKTTRR